MGMFPLGFSLKCQDVHEVLGSTMNDCANVEHSSSCRASRQTVICDEGAWATDEPSPGSSKPDLSLGNANLL